MGVILESLPVSMQTIQRKKKMKTNNTTEKKCFQNLSDLHEVFFLLTNRLFGKTDKHLTKCLTVPSFLFVCVWNFFVYLSVHLASFPLLCQSEVGSGGGNRWGFRERAEEVTALT